MAVVLDTLKWEVGSPVSSRCWEQEFSALEVVASLRGHRSDAMVASLAVWCASQPRLSPEVEALAQGFALAISRDEGFLELYGVLDEGVVRNDQVEDLIERHGKQKSAAVRAKGMASGGVGRSLG